MSDFIKSRIDDMKRNHRFLREKGDPFAFTALCVRSIYFKNPNRNLSDDDLERMLVDGANDGGADALLIDPESEDSDLIICQSKYYESISKDDIADALHKMIDFYQKMEKEDTAGFSSKVRQQYSLLQGEMGDDSKVHFVILTSAPRKGIRNNAFNEIIDKAFQKNPKFDLKLYFNDDVESEITEAESMRGSVESDYLLIDDKDNALYYADGEAVIVNIDACSLKSLYGKYNVKLLAQNLRYYVKKKDIDDQIKATIRENSEDFWFKNNGLTIICDDFDIDGDHLKLRNFSIINGGQTTTLIGKSEDINRDFTFYLTAKVIKNPGRNEQERQDFVLSVAQATNSQKAIKTADLKANTPEQVQFANELRIIGIYYQTKRGETIPNTYKAKDKNTDLTEAGKLLLAGLFQLPATSRNKYTTMFKNNYYIPMFEDHKENTAKYVKDLLYVDTFFRDRFIDTLRRKYDNDPTTSRLLSFAGNARTVCLAFVAFVSRYLKGEITDQQIAMMMDKYRIEDAYDDYFYDIFKATDKIGYVFVESIDNMNKDNLDATLSTLLEKFITYGQSTYMNVTNGGTLTNESNFLKKDQNYYMILLNNWRILKEEINAAKPIFIKQ